MKLTPATRWLSMAACAVVTLLFAPITSADAEDSAPEAALKAAFVFNFTKFVEWPTYAPAAQLRVCVVGTGPVNEALVTFDGKASLGRTISLQQNVKGAGLAQCQLVYFNGSASARTVTEALSELRNASALTVGDRDDFLDLGGMIAIRRNADRLGFEVNLPAAQAAQLKIAAPLLRMAKEVRQ